MTNVIVIIKCYILSININIKMYIRVIGVYKAHHFTKDLNFKLTFD